MEPFVGEIMLFAGNFAPRGWAFCDGQLLAVSQNDALFSLLGTTYGGDGRTTFALPDLRGRAPLHQGHGPALSDRRLGSKGGEEHVTLTANQIPAHGHPVMASSAAADSADPAGRVLAHANINLYGTAAPAADMAAATIGTTGGGQPHDNMMPYQVIHYCIALVGIYPSRQ